MDWIQSITIIGSILIPTLSGFAWIIHRMDQKFDKIDLRLEKIDQKIERIYIKLNRIDDRINEIEIKLLGLDLRVKKLFEALGIRQNKEHADT